ncbi:MAG: Proline dehydrogenase, partial [uncultured Rubrobacteraceae bacterium]
AGSGEEGVRTQEGFERGDSGQGNSELRAGDTPSGGAQDLPPIHGRRQPARGGRHGQRPQQARLRRHARRARGVHEGPRRRHGEAGAVQKRRRRHSGQRPRERHLREAHRARARPRRGALQEQPGGGDRLREGAGAFRTGRHGGLRAHGAHAPARPRHARAAREHRSRRAGLPQAEPRGRRSPRRGRGLGASLQGHLRRAPRDRLQGLRHRPAELRPPPGEAHAGWLLRRGRHARRVPRVARAQGRPRAGAPRGRLRVPDAPRGGRAVAAHTRRGRAEGSGVRAVRQGLVRVLDAQAKGEPEDSQVRSPGRRRRRPGPHQAL